MTYGVEWERVERPLLEHLSSLGWETLIWSERDSEGADFRSSNRDVLLERRLRSALLRINRGTDGEPWLDADRIDAVVAELQSMPAGVKLLEANLRSTELLLHGVTVAGFEGWDGGRDRTVHYVDWDDWDANDFLAVSQFTVATPGQAPDIRPDVTLFVNGIPMVVIETKQPGSDSSIADAIEQLRRYANQRGSEIAEGAEQLFWTNQITVATTGVRAEAATFSASAEHYMAWKDPYPASVGEVAKSLGKRESPLCKRESAVTQQELLTVGMLKPKRLLDIIRHFTLFVESGAGRAVKVVCRYQQYRGVHKALRRLADGDTRSVDGHVDRRGGIVWHTQGSGKSLTMVFLIRAMRSHPDLRRFKIVLVTDRTDLERQLGDTAALTGETVRVARSAADVRDLLRRHGPGVVMAMIQKYRHPGSGVLGDLGSGGLSESGRGVPSDTDADVLSETERFEILNESSDILVLIDEAHRSQASILHANLMNALPNATRIGFTGTPIIMGARKKTTEIFGGYLDRYTLRQSESDGSTVPIFYEGRTTEAAVKGASKMDDRFFRWFQGFSDDQRDTLQRRYITVMKVLEAPELIKAKAEDMLRHYVTTVMPGGFKAMIVATSREACLRYYNALTDARNQLVAEVERFLKSDSTLVGSPGVCTAVPPGSTSSGLSDYTGRSYHVVLRDDSFMRAAADRIDMIRALDFAPIISSGHNDPSHYAKWTDKHAQQARIAQFKLPMGHADDGNRSPLSLLIVKSMLLTGFDAPCAQAIYLDRLIQEAELLQAVARVNRTAPGKCHGLVVDYYGVSSQLTCALSAYSRDDGSLTADVGAVLRPLTSEVEKLAPQRERVRQLFVQRGVRPSVRPEARTDVQPGSPAAHTDGAMHIGSATDADGIEACVELLADEKLRAEFDEALRMFMDTFDMVLPRPQALPFVDDVKLFGEIQIAARRRYRDTPDGDFDPRKYKEKVRWLLDSHITSLDLSSKVAPRRITDSDFSMHVSEIGSLRVQALEMEHAIRFHIREHLNEDPVYYRKLSERIDEILERLQDRWDQVSFELNELMEEVTDGCSDENRTGQISPPSCPFHNIMAEKVFGTAPDTDTFGTAPDTAAKLARFNEELKIKISRAISVVGFWHNPTKQDDLRKTIKRALDGSDLFNYSSLDQLAVEIMDLTKANQHRLK